MANRLAGWIQAWKENDLKIGDKKIWEEIGPHLSEKAKKYGIMCVPVV